MNSNEARYDVAIVGLGPVGAGAALQLAHEGLKVVVIERGTEVYDLPRAVALDGEVLRAFQRIGLGDRLRAVTQQPRENDGAIFTDSRHRPLFGLQIEPTGHNAWPDIAFMDQPEIEQELRAMLDDTTDVEILLGHEVGAVRQTAEKVTIDVTRLADGADASIDARYLIACDGASSFVRRSLGIDWVSLGYDQDWLVVDIVVAEDSPLTVPTMQVCSPERLATYVCPKDPNRRFEFQLKPNETREEMADPDRVAELLAPWIARNEYTLRRAVVYQFHAATASRWREGRMFLAGDAAHQTPPFLGQGLNAGMRDAANIAWKMGRVIRGESDEGLLDTYAAERDPHARDLVEWAVAVGQLMEGLAAAEAAGAEDDAATDAAGADGADGADGAGEVDTSSGYGQERTAPPLRAGVILERQVADGSSVGYLLEQPWVRTADGNEQLLDELFGRGFVLVSREGADVSLSERSRRLLETIGARHVALDGVEVTRGNLDQLFATHEAAMLRPDRYVFGTTDEQTTADDLIAALAMRLGV